MKKWKLNDPLIDLTGKGDYLRIKDACEGVQLFGAVGSGKTSGAMQTIAKSYLLNDFGGIVLCAKKDEADTWKKYLKETNREKDMVLISKTHFDFMKYESTRTSDIHIENIVNVFMQIAEISVRDENKGSEAYWDRAGRQLLRNSITLLLLADEEMTLTNITKIIMTAPYDLKMMKDKKNRENSYCSNLIDKVKQKGIDEKLKYDYELTERYFFTEFPNLDNRTRSNIVSFFTTLADGFLRGKIREIFCSGKIDFKPEDCMHGKILIVDLSIKEHGELGRYGAAVLKFMVQQSLERRDVNAISKNRARPVFIFADESHYFITKYDQIFQTTARSVRACTVFATQNIPNYLAELKQKAVTDSILGNLQIKIFCQNGDPETNKWAAESIGREIVKRHSSSRTVPLSALGGNLNKSTSTSEQKDFILEPIVFTDLAKGGRSSNFKVGSIIWHSGRKWKNSLAHLFVKFEQKKQKRVYRSNISNLSCSLIPLITFLLLSLFIYYIINSELIYMLRSLSLILKGTHRYIIYAVLVGSGLVYGYALINLTKYIGTMFKLTCIALLCINAFYLAAYSPLHITAALVINIYLIIYVLYKLIKKLMTSSQWNRPCIIKSS